MVRSAAAAVTKSSEASAISRARLRYFSAVVRSSWVTASSPAPIRARTTSSGSASPADRRAAASHSRPSPTKPWWFQKIQALAAISRARRASPCSNDHRNAVRMLSCSAATRSIHLPWSGSASGARRRLAATWRAWRSWTSTVRPLLCRTCHAYRRTGSRKW